MLLDRDMYDLARRFVAEHGQPLSAARLRVWFDGAPATEVWDALATFRNPDGGFGHGLECDYQAPQSSVLATTVALQLVREIRERADAPTPEHLVAPAIDYLLQTLDRERFTWRIIPPGTDSSPHAPWWHNEGNEAQLATWSLNPTAEGLGYLHEYPDLVPADLRAALTETVLAYLAGQDKVVMHDFLCCKRWVETPGLDAGLRDRLMHALLRLLDPVISRDPAAWPHYVLRPGQVAESPGSPFYPALQDVIPAHLDWELGQQQANGAWMPNWDWSGAYPEAWARARLAAASWITSERLILLERHHRIAPRA